MTEALHSQPGLESFAGPGARLEAARAAQGLSREQVASQLRLNLHMVEALEADDYRHLPPAAYVTGYLRAYARLLGIAEEEVLEAYGRRNDAPSPTLGAVAKGQPAQVKASDPPVRVVTWLVVGGLLLLLGLWWFAQRELPQESASDQGGAIALAVPPAEPPAETELVPEASTETVQIPAPEELAAPAPVAEAPAPEPVAAEPAAPAAAREAEQADVPPLTADIPQSRLELSFDADCWTEITDAAGRQLYYDLGRADRRLVFYGEAPFRVFLGYSPGATISFNGAPFDHTPFQRRDIARFRIGSSADNAPRTEAE